MKIFQHQFRAMSFEKIWYSIHTILAFLDKKRLYQYIGQTMCRGVPLNRVEIKVRTLLSNTSTGAILQGQSICWVHRDASGRCRTHREANTEATAVA